MEHSTKDTVKVTLLPVQHGKRQEAQITEIVARGMKQVVGTYDKSNQNYGFVIPDNEKIGTDILSHQSVPRELYQDTK